MTETIQMPSELNGTALELHGCIVNSHTTYREPYRQLLYIGITMKSNWAT